MAVTEGASEQLQAIRYRRGHLELLDQRKFPHEIIYIDIKDAAAGWTAIQDMVVRGAPAIAIAAALALAVEVEGLKPVFGTGLEAVTFLKDRLDYLVSSRPTTVNLADAATTLLNLSQKAADKDADAAVVYEAYLEGAEKMLASDAASNKAIGAFGAEALCRGPTASGNGMRVLTHCNTGSLATSAYGTALGVIHALHAQGKLETAICIETRPYNQGSRLTAFELVHDKIPAVTLQPTILQPTVTLLTR